MREIHKPNRTQSIIFFLCSLLLAIGVLGWYFILNKGVLAITGEAPFEATVGDERRICTESPCVFRVAPHNYTVTLKKDGFFEDVQQAKIGRGATNSIQANFIFVPKLMEIKTRPAFMNSGSASEHRTVSPDKDRALVVTTTDVSIVDLAGGKKTKLAITPSQSPVWLGKNVAYIEHGTDKDEIRLRTDSSSDTIAIFPRPLKNPTLIGSGSGNYLIVEDAATDGSAYYFVDTKTASRKSLFQGTSVKNLSFAGNTLFAEIKKDDGAYIIRGFEPANITDGLSGFDLPAIQSDLIIEQTPDVFVFFSSENPENKSSASLGRSVGDVLDDVQNGFTEDATATNAFLIQYDKKTEQYTMLVAVPTVKGEEIKNLTASLDFNHLFFEKAGHTFQIDLVSK